MQVILLEKQTQKWDETGTRIIGVGGVGDGRTAYERKQDEAGGGWEGYPTMIHVWPLRRTQGWEGRKEAGFAL